MKTLTLATVLLAAGLGLAGCQRDAEIENRIEKGVAETVREEVSSAIAEELATNPIKLRGPDGAPRAEIGPQGDLLIGGQPVALDAEQRALALAYRAEIVRVAETGATLGLQGADIAREAMAEAASSLFDDNPQSIEERMQGSADALKAQARQLCDSLPQLIAAQQAFAAAVPEFAPYAEIDQADVAECRVDL